MTDESEHRFVDLEGVRLHWVELGEETDEVPLVLLHGLNNSHLTWKKVAPLLAKERRVLMLDLPGHGHSGRPDATYELSWYAHLVSVWLRALELDRVDVIGHSFGGGVAQMLLLECPERVRRLGLVASGGLGKAVGLILRLASLPGIVEYFGQPFMALGTRLIMGTVQSGITAEDIQELSAFNSLPGSARAFARTVRDVIDWRGQRRSFLEHEHRLARVPPVLVLWGDQDALIPMAQAQEFAAQLGASFRCFTGCGHFLHNESPEEFVEVIREFIGAAATPSIRSMAPPRASRANASIGALTSGPSSARAAPSSSSGRANEI